MQLRKSYLTVSYFTAYLNASRGLVRMLSSSTPKLSSTRREEDIEIPVAMRRWETSSYGSIDSLEFNPNALVPKRLKKDQVLVKVEASSVNPFDIEMIEGYGRKAMNVLRQFYGTEEFPLVPGRDCSGVIVKRGKNVRRFTEGDQIWCARWVVGAGTHAEYCVANQSEVSLKPRTLTHIESASLPYVACTSWVALVTRAGLDPSRNDNNKHVLILGGSGGIGSFSIQLAKCLGNQVTTTCCQSNIDYVKSLGADNAVDYKSVDHLDIIQQCGPFDIILDARRGGHQKEDIGSTDRAIYISLMPPFLPSIDQNGFGLGLINAGLEFYEKNFQTLVENKGKYAWGLFFPNGGILKSVAEFVDNGLIKPVVGNVFNFQDVTKALRKLEIGGTRGKIVLDVTNRQK